METASGRSPVESSRDLPTSRRRLAAYLFAAANVLAGAGDIPEVAQRILAMIGDAEGFTAGAVWLASEDGARLRCVEVWISSERPALEFERLCREGTITRGVGLAGRVWGSGRGVIVNDIFRDSDARRDPRMERGGFRSVAAVPITAGADVIGVLELFGAAAHSPDPFLGEVLASVAGQFAEFVRRKTAEKALARAQERLRTVVGNAPIVLFGFDREGRITLGEGGGMAAAGVRIEDLAGRSVYDVYRGSPIVLDHARRALAGESFTATAEVEHDGGTSRVYETRYTPMFDAQGRVAEVIGVATDITERANAERALRRSEAQLLEADRLASLGALAAGVAHEINNPLAYVLLNLELVLRDLEDPAAERVPRVLADRLREARSGVDRVRLIAQDLKSFSRIDTERRTPVDVRRVLDGAIDIAANEIRHRATLVRRYDDVPLVDADPSRLGQVFLNLLVNAVQSMDIGAAARNEIRVETHLCPDGHVAVTIADTGGGIPPSLRERIFEPFFTTKPAGVGTGLGLAIAKSIVAALGGDLLVESELGKGSMFQVILPVTTGPQATPKPTQAPIGSQAEPGASPPSEPETRRSPARRGRVLVVDDEPALAVALGRSIEGDYDVVVLSSARDALELLRRDDRFDVILCDLIMPVVTGMDFYESLARDQPALANRIVFMTGGTFTPRTREFLAGVKNPTLDKPFDLAALHALLRSRTQLT